MIISSLQECIRLSETLNFTQTAKEFYISQPVLSKHISAIEKEIGAKIFVRTSNGIKMTKVGQVFLNDAKKVFDAYSEMLEHISSAKDGMGECLTVGYLFGAASSFLLRALELYSKTRPDISVSLISCEIDEILGRLSRNEIDLGITSMMQEDPMLSSGEYAFEPLYEDGFAIIAPKNHRLASRKTASIYDLEGETLLLPSAPFMPGSTEIIASIVQPVANQLSIIHGPRDRESLQLLMKRKGTLSLNYKHLHNVIPDCVFLDVEEAYRYKLEVGIIWKRSMESNTILQFVETLKKAVE